MQQFDHIPNVSSGKLKYHGQAIQGQKKHQHQHSDAQMLDQTTSMSQYSHYVTEHSNVDVAILNTDSTSANQVPQLLVEYLSLEAPATTAGLAGSIQSWPGTLSPATGRKFFAHQDGYYTHEPSQGATHVLHSTSPMVEHGAQQPMVRYALQMPQHLAAVQAVPSQVPAAQQDEHWYNSLAYQPVTEGATIGRQPMYSSTVYDP
ncbi:hypothetical protein PG995_004560 [Apiospora arundinis]